MFNPNNINAARVRHEEMRPADYKMSDTAPRPLSVHRVALAKVGTALVTIGTYLETRALPIPQADNVKSSAHG